MPSSPTATSRKTATKRPLSTTAIPHFASSVCQRLIRVGRDIAHFGPISVGAKPSAPSRNELTIVAPMKPLIRISSEV